MERRRDGTVRTEAPKATIGVRRRDTVQLW